MLSSLRWAPCALGLGMALPPGGCELGPVVAALPEASW